MKKSEYRTKRAEHYAQLLPGYAAGRIDSDIEAVEFAGIKWDEEESELPKVLVEIAPSTDDGLVFNASPRATTCDFDLDLSEAALRPHETLLLRAMVALWNEHHADEPRRLEDNPGVGPAPHRPG